MKTAPELIVTSRLIVRRSVLLPLPDGPRRTTSAPAGISRLTSSTALRSLCSYCTDTCSKRPCVPQAGLGKTALFQKCACNICGFLFLPVDLIVEVAHHGIGEKWAEPVEGGCDLRMGREGRLTHDRCNLIGGPEVLVVGED